MSCNIADWPYSKGFDFIALIQVGSHEFPKENHLEEPEQDNSDATFCIFAADNACERAAIESRENRANAFREAFDATWKEQKVLHDADEAEPILVGHK